MKNVKTLRFSPLFCSCYNLKRNSCGQSVPYSVNTNTNSNTNSIKYNSVYGAFFSSLLRLNPYRNLQ